MGLLCSEKARRTLDAIQAACAANQREHGQPSSNVFFINGRRYFYEVSRRDQQDGGISGSVWLCLGEDGARKVGTFRIDGNGRVVRGPALFKQAERTGASQGPPQQP